MRKSFRATRFNRLKSPYKSKWEEAYAVALEAQLRAGSILWYAYEAIKLNIAQGAHYTPDFLVMAKDGALEIHEVKGHWREAAKVRWKLVKEKFPFVFKLIKKRGSAFQVEEE
jgi:hypothetical protein